MQSIVVMFLSVLTGTGTTHADARSVVYQKFTIRIGRKAMTLGGDSSRAAIARSSAIRETKRLASIELAQDDRVQRPSKLWSGMHVSEPKAKSL